MNPSVYSDPTRATIDASPENSPLTKNTKGVSNSTAITSQRSTSYNLQKLLLSTHPPHHDDDNSGSRRRQLALLLLRQCPPLPMKPIIAAICTTQSWLEAMNPLKMWSMAGKFVGCDFGGIPLTIKFDLCCKDLKFGQALY